MTNEQAQRIKRLIALMNEDLAYYEPSMTASFKRTTRRVRQQENMSSFCVNRCATTCYVINTMTYLRTSCRRCQARNTVLRRIDPVAYYEYFFKEAERLSLPIRLSDGETLRMPIM